MSDKATTAQEPKPLDLESTRREIESLDGLGRNRCRLLISELEREREKSTALLAVVKAQHEALTQNEWTNPPFGLVTCPSCGRHRQIGHALDCSLTAALSRAQKWVDAEKEAKPCE